MAKKQNKTEDLRVKPPVVVVVGHIDHGKSTLLDYIRKSNVVATETGGITQHISAYEVKHQSEGKDRMITFLDTPGHEAFSSMRSRGAQISDIAILIVSAEEGVKAQTIEALKSIQDAGLPFIVAINKVDRPNANPEKVKQELAEKEVYVESYGGKVPSVNVSAKTGEGIDDLLDYITLVADLDEKIGDQNKPAEGYILETNQDPKTGITATLIIKDGTINTGDFVGVEGVTAKIKKMENFKGEMVKEASFSSPVLLYGFGETPKAGEKLVTFKDKKEADLYVKNYNLNKKDPEIKKITGSKGEENIVEVPMVIKADTFGTLEAVEKEISKIDVSSVKIKIIDSGVGSITDGDVKILSGGEDGLVVGFRVKVDRSAKDISENFKISINTFDIIYKLTEWLEEELDKRRPQITVEEVVGQGKILKHFSSTKNKQVIGGQVNEGSFIRGREAKIIRRDTEIGRGKIVELQQQKTKADKVEAPNQFGAMIESKVEIAPGDTIEVIEKVTKSA